MDEGKLTSTVKGLQQQIRVLRKQNKELRRLASYPQLSPLPVLEFDRAGRLVHINPASLQILASLGNPDARLFLPADYIEIFTQTDKEKDTHFQRYIALGDYIYQEAIFYLDEYDSIRIYVTNLPQAGNAESVLERAEDQYRNPYNSMAHGVVCFDTALHIIYTNPSAGRILGIPARQMVGHPAADPFSQVVQADGSDFPDGQNPFVRALHTGLAVNDITMGVINPQRNQVIWVLVNAVPIYKPGDKSPYQVYATFEDITAHKLMEDALEKSQLKLNRAQELLEAVTKGTQVIIATIDTDYCFTFFNIAYKEEVKRLSGKDIELGMHLLDVFSHLPEQQKIIAQEWGQVLLGETMNKTLEFGDPGIFRRTYNVLHTPIRDAKGAIVGAGEVAYDITQQLVVQEALRESEARFRMVLKHAPVTVAAQDKELKFIWAYNQRTVNPSEVIGKTDLDLFPAETAAWLMRLKRKVIESGMDLREQGWVSSGGQRLYLDMFLEPIRDSEGQITGVGIATVDLTAMKLAELALHESEQHYHSLFLGMAEGFAIHEMIYDDHGKPSDYRFLEVNPAFEKLTGFRREDVIGRLYREVLPQEGDSWIKIFANVVLTGEQSQFENYSPTLDRYYEVLAYRCAPNQFAAIFMDISKRKQVEQAARQDHEQLEIMVQQRTEELSNANRELLAEISERKRIEAELVLQTQAVEIQRHRFNDVLEIMPVYLILLTTDYHTTFANRYFRERFGEDHGRPCYEYLFNRAEPCENCETFQVTQTGTNHRWEWLGPDGHNYDVFDFPFRDVDGSELVLELGIDITERKQAEEKLRLLNAYNRNLLETSLDALVTITPDGKIGDVNAATESITGHSRDELIGTDFSSYFTNPVNARGVYQRVLEKGTVRDFELEIQHQSGQITPVMYNATVITDEIGRVAGVFAAARDITQRKQTERQLILLTTALDAAANGIIVTDIDGNIVWSNPAFSRMTGYSAEEIIGRNPRFLKSGHQDIEFYRSLWQTILAGESWHGELINRRKDQSVYHEEQTITPVLDQRGNITNFISIKQDNTLQKLVEEALIKSEEKYRSLVIATTQIVWQTNANGDAIEDNPKWREFTGQSVDEYRGRGWLQAFHPADRDATANVWDQAVKTLAPYETEARIRSLKGTYGHFAIRGVPIFGPDSTVTGWIGTCTDITEKKSYEAQLIQSEKHAVIGRMVGSVTHEINNPLQTIKNCLYLIKMDLPVDTPIREPLEMALSESQRLANIVGQLRQLYRPQIDLSMHPQPLWSIIDDVHSLLLPHLNNSSVLWKLPADLEPCIINCIKEQIVEVMLNIGMNAIESMQPQGGTLSIRTIYPPNQQQVGVIFSDTGPGINAEILPHIFEPFTTTKEYGLGLGLPICYDIIQKHAGHITVESQPGEGTSFTIWLPIITQNDTTGE